MQKQLRWSQIKVVNTCNSFMSRKHIQKKVHSPYFEALATYLKVCMKNSQKPTQFYSRSHSGHPVGKLLLLLFYVYGKQLSRVGTVS